MLRLFCMFIGALLVMVFFFPGLSLAVSVLKGNLGVHVKRDGQPVANATVCVGVAIDLNQFYQGMTDSQGAVSFDRVPQEPFIVTANLSGRGAQQSFNPASPAGLPFLAVDLTLPASGGPSCPTTPAGPSRSLIPLRNVVVPTAPPRPPSITLTNTQFCFGALGAQCGQPQGLIPPTALCTSGICFINGGSWDHDECCFQNPRGMACQMGPLDAFTGHDGHCVTTWNKSLRLVSKGLNWKRNIDFSRANATGTVEFNLYCAPGNTLIPPEDGNKCCSRQTRGLTSAEAAAALAIGETLAACR